MDKSPTEPIGEQARIAIALLEAIAEDRALLAQLPVEERNRLLRLAGVVSRPDALARRRVVKAARVERKAARVSKIESVLSETGIRKLRREQVFTTPNVFPPANFEQRDDPGPEFREAVEPKCCYVCKQRYQEVHHFYDQLCPPCAAVNFRKRTELADLRGRVAVLTGGRVKIGYQAGIKLLRSGARLIVTTRFPRDAAARYSAEADFADWGDRLEIFGLDLRHPPSVESLCGHLLATRDRLDFIVNNACQTVRRPPAYFRHMMAAEAAAELSPTARPLLAEYQSLRGRELPSEVGRPEARLVPTLPDAPRLSQIPLVVGDELGEAHFPAGVLDQDLQQLDLRETNSWRYLLAQVPTVELLEVHLVNAVAPFVFNARLKPLMTRTPERDKHIVNVSAVEGQFYRRFKTTRHPHTNMAKAALNMMTRTAATDYHGDGIHMNSVDTGWVTDEDVEMLAARKTAEHRFHPPLDIVDGAARIVDPIIAGFNTGHHVWGQFLKDYESTDW